MNLATKLTKSAARDASCVAVRLYDIELSYAALDASGKIAKREIHVPNDVGAHLKRSAFRRESQLL